MSFLIFQIDQLTWSILRRILGEELFYVNRALRAIRYSDVTLLVIDATAGVSEQDRTLAQTISNDGCACIILCNKWDAVVKDSYTFELSICEMN